MVTLYLAQTEYIIVYQADHYFIPLLAYTAGIFIGRVKAPCWNSRREEEMGRVKCIMVLYQTRSHSFIRSWTVELLSFFPLKKAQGSATPGCTLTHSKA